MTRLFTIIHAILDLILDFVDLSNIPAILGLRLRFWIQHYPAILGFSIIPAILDFLREEPTQRLSGQGAFSLLSMRFLDFVYWAKERGQTDPLSPRPGPRPADDATSEKQIPFRQKDAGIEG